MNIMNRVTWRAMWKNRTRTLVTVVGVLLSAAMFMAVCTMGISIWHFFRSHETMKNGDHFIRIHFSTQEQVSALQEEKGVTKLGISQTLGYSTFYSSDGGSETSVIAAVDEAYLQMAPVKLLRGRLPQTSSELVITENIYYYLLDMGKPCEVGDTVELTIDPALEDWDIPAGEESYTKEFQIVGVMERFYKINGENFNLSSLLTFADGQQEAAIWHTALVKTMPAQVAMDMSHSAEFGTCYYRNDDLMGLYGVTVYVNYNMIIFGLCAVVIAVILVGSVSLIYNAFSISVAERTQQFGLLSCVGATKRQIRRSVFFEGAVLCALGIPLGIACGYGGICVTLRVVGEEVNYLMQGSFSSAATLEPVFSIPAAGVAALIGIFTVLLSAWIPAKKATSIEPIRAIRQTEEYRVPKKTVRFGKLEAKLWGLPGLLSKKYYSTARSKYRNTVISLTVSVVLFLTAASFGSELNRFSEKIVNTENHDLLIHHNSRYDILQIRDMEQVERSALVKSDFNFGIALRPEQLSEEYTDVAEQSGFGEDFIARYVNLFYLEDDVLREYLVDKGIDPEPYFAKEDPAALVCDLNFTLYGTDEEGNAVRTTHIFSPLTEQTQDVQIISRDIPEEVIQWVGDEEKYLHYDERTTDGTWLLRFIPFSMADGMIHTEGVRGIYVEVEPCIIDGMTCQRYYPYDISTMSRTGEVIFTQEVQLPEFHLGARITELPYGVSSDGRRSFNTVMLILPLSQKETESPDLAVSVSDYESFSIFVNQKELACVDHLQAEKTYRVVGILLDVFTNGFIILISLICVCNVFNTISTNIALRRKDFGVLRSVGMKLSETRRMLMFECAQYGGKALLLGLPLGLAASYGVYLITNSDEGFGFAFPWAAMLTAAVAVLAVVFLSMWYAIFVLEKDNPIEAIRRENI